MFADLELVGIPHRVTIGERGLKDGKVEYQARREANAGAGNAALPLAEIGAFLKARLGNA
jgi:prolyl-tRNA synthetase